MENKSKSKGKVIIIGGSGYIGIHATKEFLDRGYTVTVASRNPQKVKDILPDSVNFIKFDLYQITASKLEEILKGFDYLIYAAGVDDRNVPKAPAYEFFYNHNVVPSRKVFLAANRVKIKKAVLLSSYFCHFNRKFPDMHLSESHSYIKSRIEQEKESLKACSPNVKLTILELPYVIGSDPSRKHLLNPLVKYLYSSLPIFITAGGTAVITVENVAEAIVGAIENNITKDIYPIADKNLTWNSFWKEINKKKVPIILPKWLLKTLSFPVKIFHWIQGKESGIDPVNFIDVQTINTFLPIEQCQSELKYGSHSIKEAFQEIVEEVVND